MKIYKTIKRNFDAIIVWIVLVGMILLLVKYVMWNEKRNEALDVWAVKYEACVKNEYKVDPSTWRNSHGEYPPCDVN